MGPGADDHGVPQSSAPTTELTPQLRRRAVLTAYAFAHVSSITTALWPGWTGLDRTPLLVVALGGVLVSVLFALAPRPPGTLGPHLAIGCGTVLTTLSVHFADGTAATGAYVLLYALGSAHIALLTSRRAAAVHLLLPFVGLPLALVTNGHGDEVVGWLAVLPCATVVPTLVVRTIVSTARRRAAHDPDLDLLNRAGLVAACADRLARTAGSPDTAATVSVVHFDDLRELRLALGRDAAETLLAESARRLADLPGAVVARVDLDALAVVRPVAAGSTGGSLETGRREGLALRALLQGPVPLTAHGLQVRPETSVGVACVPDHGTDLEELLAAADVALVPAAAVPTRVAVAEGAAVLDVDALTLHTELPAAIADGQLRVFFQPLLAAGTRRMVGAEALVRWQHPERGLLGPGAFVPLAERSQAIVALTHWVLRTAVAQCAQWRAAGHDLGVSVNLSPAVLGGPTLVDVVREVIAEHGLPPSVLTLEVTESALVDDPRGAAAVLAALRAAGARVSLDDFGTGYTSLTLLRQLEVDELKIDRTFVAAAPQAPADAAIVRALVDLAHRLSIEVVAEGVEDARTADLVTTLGADVLQGFHFARPVPAAEVFTALAPAPEEEAPPLLDPALVTVEVPAPRTLDEAHRLVLARAARRAATASPEVLTTVVALAAELCGTEFASLNVVEADHVHLVVRHGHDVRRTLRDGTPCSWTATGRDVVELTDPAQDPRFAGGEAVAAGLRRYLGAPVVDALGNTVAVLCAYDTADHPFTPGQRSVLRSLAALVADHLAGTAVAAVLPRVHAALQALPELDRDGDACELLSQVTDAVQDLLRPDLLLVVRPTTPLGDRWDLVDHRGQAPSDLLRDVVFDARERSAVSRAVVTERPVWVPDATTSSLIDAGLAERLGASSVLAVPVLGVGGASVVLSAVWNDPQPDLHPALRDAVVAVAARAGRDPARGPVHLLPGVG